MSTTIDERVVSMKFDNSQFQEGVSDTLSTLDKLKSSLSFADESNKITEDFSSIEESSKKVTLKSLLGNVENVASKFSILETIAIGALLNIGKKAEDVGSKLVKSLMVDQITAGWQKYGQKNQAEQMMVNQGYAIEDIENQLEKLNWFTDETSYSFSDMVSNVSKFTSQGIDLEDAVTDMQGISVWAAASGAGINGASRAMYNLSQALGLGSVRVQDWMSIENANMATKEFKETVIKLAEAEGKLKPGEVTIANFRSTLETGWFDTELLNKTLSYYGKFSDVLNETTEMFDTTATEMLQYIDRYKAGTMSIADIADALGTSVAAISPYIKTLASDEMELGMKSFKAAQEAVTFQQAIDATKDAISTGWMKTFDLIFGNYEKAKQLWTDLANRFWDIFASGAETRNAILAKSFNSSWDNFASGLASVGVSASAFEELMIENAKKSGKDVEALMTEYGSFYDSLQAGWADQDTVLKSMDQFIGELERMSAAQLEETGYTKEDIKQLKEFREELATSGSAMNEYINSFEKRSARDNLADSIINICDAIIELKEVVSDAFIDVFFPGIDDSDERINSLSDIILKVSERIKAFTESLKLFREETDKDGNTVRVLTEKGENLSKMFKGIFSIVKLVKDIIVKFATAIGSPVIHSVGSLGGSLLSLAGSIGEVLSKFAAFIEKSKWFQGLFTGLGEFASSAYETLRKVFSDISGAASKLWEEIKKLGENIREFISGVFADNSVKTSLFSSATDDVSRTRDSVISLSDILDWFSEKLAKLNNKFNEVVASIKAGFDSIGKMLSIVGKKIKDFFSDYNIGDLILFLSAIFTWLEGIRIQKAQKSITEFIKTVSGSLTSILNNIKTFTKIGGEINKTLEGVRTSMEKWQKSLKAKFFKQIGLGILELALALLILSRIKPDKLEDAIAAVAVLFGYLMAFYYEITKLDTGKSIINAKWIIQLGAALTLFSVSLAIISYIAEHYKIDSIQNAMGMMGVMLLGILGFIAVLNVITKKVGAIDRGVVVVLAVAGSILLLAASVALIANTLEKSGNIENVGKALAIVMGLIVIFGLLAALLAYTTSQLPKDYNTTNLVAIAAVIAIFAMSVQAIATTIMLMAIEISKLEGGWLAVRGAMWVIGELSAVIVAAVLALTAIGLFKGVDYIGIIAVMTAFTGCVVAMGGMVVVLGFIPETALTAGLESVTHIAVLLTGCIAALITVSKLGTTSTLAGIALTLTSFASAIAILALVATYLGLIDPATFEQGYKSVVKIAALITVFVSILAAVNRYVGNLKAVGTGLILIASSFVVFSVGAALFGAALVLIAIGLETLAGALKMLATLGLTSLATIVAGLFAMLPMIVAELALTFAEICELFIAMAPTIEEAVLTLVTMILNVVEERLPRMRSLVTVLLIQIMHALDEAAPIIWHIILTLLTTLGEYIRVEFPKWLEFIVSTFEQLLKAGRRIHKAIIDGVYGLIMGILDMLLANARYFGSVGLKIIAEFINGLTDGLDELTNAVIGLVTSIAVNMIHGFNSFRERVGGALKDLLFDGLNNMVDLLGDFLDFGKNVILNIVQGIIDQGGILGKAASWIAGKLAGDTEEELEIESPSKVFYQIGEYVDEGLANGLTGNIKTVDNATGSLMDNMRAIYTKRLGSVMSDISNIMDEEMGQVDPVITPVMDLSEIQNDADKLKGLLKSTRSDVSATAKSAIQISNLENSRGDNSLESRLTETLTGVIAKQTPNITNETTNTFNITGNDSKEIANEVSRILQTQVERKQAQWA